MTCFTQHRNPLRLLLAVLLLMFLGAPSVTLAAKDDDMAELQQRFKQRFPELAEMKSEGRVGETFEGFVGVVKGGDDEAGDLANEENDDRKQLYRIIARKEDTTPEKVGRRNAERLFEKAKKGEHLRDEDGEWNRK